MIKYAQGKNDHLYHFSVCSGGISSFCYAPVSLPPSAGCICPEIPYSRIFTVTPYFLSSWLWKPVYYPVCGFECLGTCHDLGDVAC